MYSATFWMGSAARENAGQCGLHYDALENFHVLLSGRKVRLTDTLAMLLIKRNQPRTADGFFWFTCSFDAPCQRWKIYSPADALNLDYILPVQNVSEEGDIHQVDWDGDLKVLAGAFSNWSNLANGFDQTFTVPTPSCTRFLIYKRALARSQRSTRA